MPSKPTGSNREHIRRCAPCLCMAAVAWLEGGLVRASSYMYFVMFLVHSQWLRPSANSCNQRYRMSDMT